MRSRPWLTLLRRCCREVGGAVLDLAAPPRCAACAAYDGNALCAPCRQALDRLVAPVCERCGVPLGWAEGQGSRSRCDDAVRHAALRHVAMARAAYFYAGTGGALVRRLKFHSDRAAARLLTAAMVETVRGPLLGELRRAVVVPVPLSRRRRRQRGFDQAAMLAGGVAAALCLELGVGVLRRCRDTLPQGDPRVTNRERNLAGAFAVARPRRVRGRTVLLVDDVLTSGSTVRTCARALRQVGCDKVVVLTACRARH